MSSEKEKMVKTENKKIYMAHVDPISAEQYEEMLDTLRQAVHQNDESVVEAVASVVDTYHPWKD